MYNISGIGKIRGGIWFTADTLFGSESVIDKFGRPFHDSFEMDEEIIKKWNDSVRPVDVVYHLGNFSQHEKQIIGEILDRLNGRINLIVGEYDTNHTALAFRKKFASVNYKLDFSIDHYEITLNHFPQRTWKNQDRGAFHLHGSTKGTLAPELHALTLDVTVDTNEFNLYHIEDIIEIMERKKRYIHGDRISFSL